MPCQQPLEDHLTALYFAPFAMPTSCALAAAACIVQYELMAGHPSCKLRVSGVNFNQAFPNKLKARAIFSIKVHRITVHKKLPKPSAICWGYSHQTLDDLINDFGRLIVPDTTEVASIINHFSKHERVFPPTIMEMLQSSVRAG